MRHDYEESAEERPGFSLIVHHRDPKSGLVTRETPYTLRVLAAPGGGKTQVWERPAGSGNLFDKNNKPVGRWDAARKEGERYLKDEAHVTWIPPETQDQKLARTVVESEQKIKALEQELAAIKAEELKKKAPAPQKKDQGA